jgi:CheY-like chemotaxis protein
MIPSARKVLLIDDSPFTNEVTGLVLEQAGFEVRAAENRRQFEEILAHWWPDVAIIDVEMPDVDGTELCTFLKSRIVVKVVLFSNLAPEALAERARACGADASLSKRTGYHELSQRVLELCEAAVAAPIAITRHRILLIDDSEIGRHFASALLSLAGFEVRAAASVAEFDDYVATWKPHIVLTDIEMPELDGASLCRRLKSDPATAAIPVVLFSSIDPKRLADVAREVGADAHLSKDRGYEQLGDHIRELCETLFLD